MDQLNRYQFEGGVQGLTKMAAQASLLRFDMRETFSLADNLYKPERAIEVASAFQRLGLAVGDLADPFRLMNDSINNPQGIQDSLVNVAKQFTYLDSQTKTFKITPEGVLRLKELQEQTGVNANEMMKLGLAAKEADARLSAISSIGLNVKEEDKQLLSNISRMGDGGEYEISVKDSATGERRWEKLTSVSQQQLEATLKEQKEGPKSLEDIARSQLDYGEQVAGDVRAIYHGFMYGFASNQTINKEVEGGRRLTDAITGTLSDFYGKNLTPNQARDLIKNETIGIYNKTNLEEKAISLVGKPLYDALIKGYTQKQWQTPPTDLPPEIITRLPVKYNFNDNYFDDRYQGLPLKGYSNWFDNMVADPLIKVFLGTDFFNVKEEFSSDKIIIYTGPIDRFFNFSESRLWEST
jgi:hypothetical protein